MITRRVTSPRSMGPTVPAAPPVPVVQPADEMIYRGYRIEGGSYSVGNTAWTPRAVVSVKAEDGSWQPTPLYATSSAKFPTRHEADTRALEVARAWVDASLDKQRASRP